MTRITGVDPNDADEDVTNVFEAQEQVWGDALKPYLLYARRPSILMAVRGMWDAIGESGLLSPALASLVCRRVASINSCVF